MADQDFQNRIFEALSGIESRLEKRLEAIELQAKENNDRLEKRLDTIDTRLGTVEHDVGWIKGKLEGKQEINAKILPICSASAATAALIIALIALFNG